MVPRVRRPVALLLAAIIALSACTAARPTASVGSGSPTPSPSRTPSASPSPEPLPPAPLTGLPVVDEAVLERPVLAVKIDNHTAARPHVGLDRADVIYEEVVEGGITRFIAVFHSRNAPAIGPIRSARVADISVLRDWGRPLLAYSGASRYTSGHLARARLVLLRHATTWWRDGSRPAPHNLFASSRILWRAGGSRATTAERLFDFGVLPEPPDAVVPPPQEVLDRSVITPDGAARVAELRRPSWPQIRRLRIPFAGIAWTAVWRYHEPTKRYRRAQGNTPHRLADGTRLTARNVLVLHLETEPPGPGAPHPQPEIVFRGTGKAVLLRDGVRIDGTWSRAPGGRTTFRDDDGRPFTFRRGVTWVELVPRGVPTFYR